MLQEHVGRVVELWCLSVCVNIDVDVGVNVDVDEGADMAGSFAVSRQRRVMCG